MASSWLPRWFYQLASPRWCYSITGKLIPWFAAIGGLLFVIGLVWGLAFAPSDYQQGNSFRIIYLHVPTAILAQSFYMLMAIAGAIGLIWKMKVADMVAKSVAPLGAALAVLALATGAIWGKPTWGSWWVWDARLTSMLVLLFLYLGVMALNSAIESETTAAKSTAVLALVGLVNIPIIKYSVEWWNTLHQPATFKITEKPAMPAEMWMPLLVMVIALYLVFGLAMMLRLRNEILTRERRAGWVKELLGS
ncbi:MULTISPECIES: heme ABC transporter permease CcmC [unclassified Marinobacterium]|jgi:heme exporter protein C|uniref:heme ABC transporter permease CcmC n=1 Tax=unclassified Marinobacterium TaxID=2644139 RepID=UPI00156924D9|nr:MULTISPECIES: heme ABC transporter permease CcmC [unclassified Marinobacterium]NRP09324.1 Heme exporter protein C [Marinobacterium sp. xm-g-48]NRP15261.1 Heme exporter protein C [Marinobacterium sp. xm-a-152]NRP26672.1 Heme exporter protein C [Marinobacterium sp. xm-d-420]NRP35583.1 Heme exporter protein C [Marinobacterium sp. xm-d-579]NRP37680.1 Heme exporter protein C [Marinobacterium sp. xm-a-121]